MWKTVVEEYPHERGVVELEIHTTRGRGRNAERGGWVTAILGEPEPLAAILEERAASYDEQDLVVAPGLMRQMSMELQERPLGERAALVEELTVRDEFQRTGMGSQIMKAVMKELGERGVNHVYLQHEPDSPWLGKWYRRFGFRPFATLYGADLAADFDVMMAELD